MTIKDIILRALKYAGRDGLARSVETNANLTQDESQTVETMRYCVCAVEDELARYYFTLVYEEELTAIQGRYTFTNFKYRPIKILSVSANGKPIDYVQYTAYLTCDAPKISIKYEYAPSSKVLSNDSSFDEKVVSMKLIAAGATSEYFLINGEMKQAEFWESVYREEIDGVRRKKLAKLKFPPRRWL